MKKIILTILIFSFTSLIEASMYQDFERPIIKAPMGKIDVVDGVMSTGVFQNIANIYLTATKKESEKDYTGFVLSYDVPIKCIPEGNCHPLNVVLTLRVDRVEDPKSKKCNKVFFASLVPTSSTVFKSLTMMLTDTSLCAGAAWNPIWRAEVHGSTSSNSGNDNDSNILLLSFPGKEFFTNQ